jgi:lipoic acid synthetase
VESALRDLRLHAICEEARCPNRGECYERGAATFLVLGDICTRGCGFCAVSTGVPLPPAPDEPERLAEAAARLGLRHVVITMVDRDDLPDGGAAHVARAVRAVRERTGAVVEVLASDFRGDPSALETVLASAPGVFNHNEETVPRLYPRVRPGGRYPRSLEVLRRAAARRGDGAAGAPLVKSGLMVGLGESGEEVLEVCRDLRRAGVDLLTIGQYLSPGPGHLPVERFVPPEEFDALAAGARALGFRDVFAGPYVRSSYLAERAMDLLEGRQGGGE